MHTNSVRTGNININRRASRKGDLNSVSQRIINQIKAVETGKSVGASAADLRYFRQAPNEIDRIENRKEKRIERKIKPFRQVITILSIKLKPKEAETANLKLRES